MQKAQPKSIKTNYILNVLRVASIAVISIFTIPHVSRVLGPENLGRVEYVFTILNYFVLFSALGIPMYGIREVARYKDDSRGRNKVVLELYLILLVTTLLSYLGIFVVYQLAYFASYRDLIVIMSAMVLLSNAGAEWFFQGTENQLFITVRNVIVRALVFVLILYFISVPGDYKVYALLLVIANFGANIFNFIIILRGILKEQFAWKEVDLKRHFRPVLTIFIATISVNIYLQLDYLLIGSFSGAKYVGFYSIANKLIRFLITFITLVGAVLLPRVSYLYLNDREQYKMYLAKSFNILLLMSVPFSVFFFVYAENIVQLMGGPQFIPSVLTMKILSPLCLIVSMAYFLGFIVLYPQSRERIYTFATVISALLSLGLNYFAIRYYQQNGAAVVAVLAELVAIVVMYAVMRKKNLLDKIIDGNTVKVMLAGLGMFIFAAGLQYQLRTNFSLSLAGMGFSFAVYAAIALLLRERFTQEMLQLLLHKTGFKKL